MPPKFFSKRVPLFASVGMLILCTVYFLLPFALRGARLAVGSIKNNVADWLPADYPETQDLEEFRKSFIGDTFVVVSGPWCKADNPAFINLERKIFEESLDYERVLRDANKKEEIRAHKIGDDLGLMFTGTYHEDWGLERERWLLGKNGQWYFINRRGELFEWKGQNNIVEGFNRFVEKTVHGKNKAIGKNIGKFGNPPNDAEGIENEFYADPQKLCARPFKSVTTGPSALEEMAGEKGTIKIGASGEDSKSALDAKIEAHRRLTGALFGQTPPSTFGWTYTSLLQHVEDKNVRNMLQNSEEMKSRFDAFIEFIVGKDFEGEFTNLQNAGPDQQIDAWYRMWDALEVSAPARQTCLIVTLNDPVIEELSRAVGRPLFGKARGRILELATGECGISPENLHLGGPPCDNVAIDEEGTNTLLRLVSLSALIGISLAYFSFKSIRVTCMLFFVAGVAAISSLSYVWFAGSTLDAILLSMPSLVYVLALSSAVHLVNYYRDACHETGPETAVEKAFSHAFFPCSLAAFTTALGLISLYTSNLIPIKKFGLFSAIAVLATVILLFTYLPAALSVWSPGYKKLSRKEREKSGTASEIIGRIWSRIGEWVIRHHAIVAITSILLMGVAAYGITRVETSVHLLKLFDKSAKILGDYRWMENNLGKLVPMELMVRIDKESQKEFKVPPAEDAKTTDEDSANDDQVAANGADEQDEGLSDEPTLSEEEKKELEEQQAIADTLRENLKYSILERVELSQRIRKQLERVFGPESLDIVGRGMSMDVFLPMQNITQDLQTPALLDSRRNYSNTLASKRDQMIEQDYLAIDPKDDSELWRISIRLAALNDVDYGEFIDDIKTVVEPIMLAYEKRTELLAAIQENMGEASIRDGGILILGTDPRRVGGGANDIVEEGLTSVVVDQTYLFADTLHALLENRGYERSNKPKTNKKFQIWLDPHDFANNPEKGSGKRQTPTLEKLVENFKHFECVVLLNDAEMFGDVEFLRENLSKTSKVFIDARDHQYVPGDGETLTARERKLNDDSTGVTTVYTGIIPIVYKSQRALLHSLIESICLAFIMIAIVMMILLRNWNRPFSPKNSLNVAGGMISMIPNVFPVVLIFGAMGLLAVKVDIGSMMTASVAMGVAVDDTIHYLNWYRKGLSMGLTRISAIRMAYDRVATAMTQTTLIGGFGLSAFAFSTFTPTQRFGVLMLILLVAALIGDLILLPAILAGPLGRFFGKEKPDAKDELTMTDSFEEESLELRVVDADADGTPDAKVAHRPGRGDEKNVADG